jgi:hypothetical protein
MSTAYLQYNKQLSSTIKSTSKAAEKIAGKEAVVASGIAYTALGSQKLKLRLPYRLVLQYKFEDRATNINWRYDF